VFQLVAQSHTTMTSSATLPAQRWCSAFLPSGCSYSGYTIRGSGFLGDATAVAAN
jgi:hypothetical protein